MVEGPTHQFDEHDRDYTPQLRYEPNVASARQRSPAAPLLVTVEEAARRLSIGRTAAYLLVLRGELQSVKIGRTRRVVVASLEAYIQRLLDNE